MFGREPEYALYEISWLNARMYSSAMPMMGDGEKDKDAPAYDESLDACNPDNFGRFDAPGIEDED